MKPTLHYITLFLITACLLLTTAEQTYAQWSNNPAVNNAISTAIGDQRFPMIVSDGSGGAIITWQDRRSGAELDIYAQSINASGTVQWTANGVAICTATGYQSSPAIVSDGSGGAIITWHDSRSGPDDIYAQSINTSGTVQWTADGVAICTAIDYQDFPTIISDGAGGAIITWGDRRSGTNDDIYAQRINASGTVQWTANGVAICTATSSQDFTKIVSDGSGGAIITWKDGRNGNDDIYAQRINSSGTVQWTANGVAICTAINVQSSPAIASDGSGGAIITWQDDRNGVDYDIYAQRINASGTIQWTADGVAICTAIGYQFYPTIISDGAGGAIITWKDGRNGNDDIYAQRINSSGTVQWTANGVAICTATSNQSSPTIVSDGLGGAIITWHEFRIETNNDIYAQSINASGTVQWTANGVAICTATGGQDSPMIVSDGSGGAIITWYDFRSGTNYDIYAQRIYENSALPVELVSFAAQALSRGVVLSWTTATEVNNYGFEVERKQIPHPPSADSPFAKGETSEASGGFVKAGFVEGAGTTNSPRYYSYTDNNLKSGKYLYRLKQIDRDGQFEYSQSVEVTIGQTPALFELAQNYPNPFNPTTTIEFTVPGDGKVSLKIYNMLGQKVATLFDGEAKAGYIQKATFNASQIASGVYFSRLEFGGKSLLKKIVLMK